ncbi:MAG: hypothetical protein ACI4ON_02710 [Clostridia bacterium]
MDYVEFKEWKELKKEKKYKEAVDNLMTEIATNLLRVHNYYSDVKFDLEKQDYKAYGNIDFAKNSKDDVIEEMRPLIRKSFELSHLRMTYCDIQEDSRWGTYKELLKDTEKLRKKLQKQYKKYKEI